MRLPISQSFIERNAIVLLIATLITVAIGGLVEVVPLFTIQTTVVKVPGIRPYSPLELLGRQIYLREGCYLCHSQQIRNLRDEVARYGHPSIAAESMYDHPFQWGSKRIGPDLARVGGKYSNAWMYQHLIAPRSVVPESIMPDFAFLAQHKVDTKELIAAMKTNIDLGVPYTAADLQNAMADLQAQAFPNADHAGLLSRYPKAMIVNAKNGEVTQLDAVVAYLQILGRMVNFANPAVERALQAQGGK